MTAFETERFQRLGPDQLIDPNPPMRGRYISVGRADLVENPFADDPDFQGAWEVLQLVGENPTVVGLAFYQRPTWGKEYEVLLGTSIDPDSDVDRILLYALNEKMFALAGEIDGFAPRIGFFPVESGEFDPNAYIEQSRRNQRELIALVHFT